MIAVHGLLRREHLCLPVLSINVDANDSGLVIEEALALILFQSSRKWRHVNLLLILVRVLGNKDGCLVDCVKKRVVAGGDDCRRTLICRGRGGLFAVNEWLDQAHRGLLLKG